MENLEKQKTNVLLTLPSCLNDKLQDEAKKQQRKRHAQIIFILESFFAEKDKEAKKK